MGKYSKAVIEWENDISDWSIEDDDEWEKEKEIINKLVTKQDIVTYYLQNRGFHEEKYLMENLLYFIARLK